MLQIGCFSRSSSISDGSLRQPIQARLGATFEGAAALSAAGGAAAVALAASLSAFSAFSASRTSLVAAPKSGCCSRSLASSGLKPRSGSATRSPRTASSKASDISVTHHNRHLHHRGARHDEVVDLRNPPTLRSQKQRGR
eukprot:scaffold28807_cov67-Phaeocystis_antarctica.AAC.13